MHRCQRCLDMLHEPGNYSDAMLVWVNAVARAVAEKYPDKILISHAYGPTQPAPVRALIRWRGQSASRA